MTTNSVRESLIMRRITGKTDIGIENTKDSMIIVFTQPEKFALLQLFGATNNINKDAQVFMINEYQGNQAANVTIIRLNAKPVDIYSSTPYILVAIMQHTNCLLYLTVNDNDALSKIISNKYDAALLAGVFTDLSGGGYDSWKT